MILTVIEQLDTLNLNKCERPLLLDPVLSPHVRMCPLLLKPLLPILQTSFMDNP